MPFLEQEENAVEKGRSQDSDGEESHWVPDVSPTQAELAWLAWLAKLSAACSWALRDLWVL